MNATEKSAQEILPSARSVDFKAPERTGASPVEGSFASMMDKMQPSRRGEGSASPDTRRDLHGEARKAISFKPQKPRSTVPGQSGRSTAREGVHAQAAPLSLMHNPRSLKKPEASLEESIAPACLNDQSPLLTLTALESATDLPQNLSPDPGSAIKIGIPIPSCRIDPPEPAGQINSGGLSTLPDSGDTSSAPTFSVLSNQPGPPSALRLDLKADLPSTAGLSDPGTSEKANLEKSPMAKSSIDGVQDEMPLSSIASSRLSEIELAQLSSKTVSPGQVHETGSLTAWGEATTARRTFNRFDGIVTAKTSDMTQTESKMNRITSRVEQNLPETVVARPNAVEPDFAFKDVPARGQNSFPWLPMSTENQFGFSSQKVEEQSPVRHSTPAEEVGLQISKQAVALRHFNADSMAVVLKPDPETAIFLHLRLQGREVEVQARLESGDYEVLSAGWPHLQESLAAQGIRLGPLEEAVSNHYSSSDSSFGKFSQQNGEPHSPPRASEPEDLTLARTPARSLKSPQKQHAAAATSGHGRQWESWA